MIIVTVLLLIILLLVFKLYRLTRAVLEPVADRYTRPEPREPRDWWKVADVIIFTAFFGSMIMAVV